MEDFAAAFVRFESGATLILETSWLLHHDTMGEDTQIWLYGSKGGCHWPSAKFLETNTQRSSFTTDSYSERRTGWSRMRSNV